MRYSGLAGRPCMDLPVEWGVCARARPAPLPGAVPRVSPGQACATPRRRAARVAGPGLRHSPAPCRACHRARPAPLPGAVPRVSPGQACATPRRRAARVAGPGLHPASTPTQPSLRPYNVGLRDKPTPSRALQSPTI